MIDETFLHCRGIGPKTERRLKNAGYLTWDDCLTNNNALPLGTNVCQRLLTTLRESKDALNRRDIAYFTAKYPTSEHWRILGAFHQQAMFFDIETSGLSTGRDVITVITAFHSGNLYTFVYDENLDDFLDLVDQSQLLVAFNGNSFDIPFLENAFNIPDIGRPYIDLRWICYHQGYAGGLKHIEKQMAIARPDFSEGICGADAVSLFFQWQKGNIEARDQLVSYCQIDTLAARLVAERILQEKGVLKETREPADLFKLAGAYS